MTRDDLSTRLKWSGIGITVKKQDKHQADPRSPDYAPKNVKVAERCMPLPAN